MPIKIGLIGKTNTGKTTFFNSSTLSTDEISTYPFTTKKPSTSIGHAITLCVHKEFNVQDNPNNSKCSDGWRYIPIELIDLPGLITDAWKGKGLGNQFLSIAAQSDALLHVVDASASIDSSGRITETGTGDPVSDFADIEEELNMWYQKILEGNRDKLQKMIKSENDQISALTELYQGLGIKKNHVMETLRITGLEGKDVENYNLHESKKFSTQLRKISKPTRGIPGYRARIRPIVSRITIHWPSFYNVVTGKTLALPNLIALQHIPLSPAGVIAKRPAPIALPNSCAAEWRMAPDAVFSPYASVRYFTPHMVHSQYNLL